MNKFKVGDSVKWLGLTKATVIRVDAGSYPYYLKFSDGDKVWVKESQIEMDEPAPKLEPKLYKVKGSFELDVETYYFVAESLAELEKMIEKEISPYEIISIDLIRETIFV